MITIRDNQEKIKSLLEQLIFFTQLVRDLKRFAQHHQFCSYYNELDCDCGLDEIFSKSEH